MIAFNVRGQEPDVQEDAVLDGNVRYQSRRLVS